MNNITVSEVQEGEFQGQWAVYTDAKAKMKEWLEFN